VSEVRERLAELRASAEIVAGDPDSFETVGGNPEKGAFFPPVLLYCENPTGQRSVHDVEAFGPVNTVMAYSSVEEAIELARMGRAVWSGLFLLPTTQSRARSCSGQPPITADSCS